MKKKQLRGERDNEETEEDYNLYSQKQKGSSWIHEHKLDDDIKTTSKEQETLWIRASPPQHY